MAKRIRRLPLRPLLKRLSACPESLRWLARNKFPTFQEAVAACPDPTWLAWLLVALYDKLPPSTPDLEYQAYLEGCEASRKYWKRLEDADALTPSGTRKSSQQMKDSLVVEAAAYRDTVGSETWLAVEKALLELGLASDVWPARKR